MERRLEVSILHAAMKSMAMVKPELLPGKAMGQGMFRFPDEHLKCYLGMHAALFLPVYGVNCP